MTYQDLYTQIIEKLKRGARPQLMLTPEIILELKLAWLQSLKDRPINEDVLKKILCILDNTQNMTAEFNELFLSTLKQIKNDEISIYLLAASQKHIIAESLRSGNMISADYIEQLKILLQSKNPEVLEWTLRTIESMGPLSLRFVKEVKAAKPNLLKLFNRHKKASSQIIELMEKQWEKMQS